MGKNLKKKKLKKKNQRTKQILKIGKLDLKYVKQKIKSAANTVTYAIKRATCRPSASRCQVFDVDKKVSANPPTSHTPACCPSL